MALDGEGRSQGRFPPRPRLEVLPVVGRRSSPAQVVLEALQEQGFLSRSKRRKWSDDQVVKELVLLAGALPAAEGGLLVVIDEMGKFLEAAAQDNGDIYFLQLLAEAASRSEGRLILVGVLHQAFDEYAQRVSRDIRGEWSKVQGRFIDLVISASGDEQLELLSRAIEVTGGSGSKGSAATIAKVVRSNRSTSKDLEKTLRACRPLHPAVACLLGPISRRRFGQNQRSLFGFLTSAEPYGFQDFLDTAKGKRKLPTRPIGFGTICEQI